ncbi:N-acetyl sugar amidotransferase [Paenibacillus alginolyticus]|uniref:N-acetyl sugar amidotransferase n=2 Tax=Paenibacillus alginolyticus TaxID=59839 RepID=A0ABT4G858_9BACL|nr:N-acetyl sugar amidotransferase [Paenibacillus alginolyticus]MCY9692362.1 N-acetyl sugar amidotransferase [Paenibacillus alginolyticus]
MRYCTKCVYPAIAATPLTFDENGVCSGCRVADQRMKINWEERGEYLRELFDEYRSTGSNYDCLIPVSGGKDSYFQAHIVTKVYGLKPLLVTYYHDNFIPAAERNLFKMREVFDCDHIIFRPSKRVLSAMNRATFKMMGDMNWHYHTGIFTYPVQIAAQHKIPLIVWGEHGFMDLGGMYSYKDFIEMTAKFRLEHAQRGYDWHHMLGKEGLTEKDLLWAKYPTDEELEDVGIRGIYLSNYVNWEANNHTKLVIEKYGWETSDVVFERTYRNFSNLDDIYENGIKDYLKYVKFGYGRATDHACKDIRAGVMTRDEGIEMVRKYDHVKSSDLYKWLDYVGMTEEEFDQIADTFRDGRVWNKDENNNWYKQNIWDAN